MQSNSKKMLAFPASSRAAQPFERISNIVLTGAYCGLSVCVLCFSGELLAQWQQQLAADSPVILLDLLNSNRATLADWKGYLRDQHYDLVVLHGVQSEMKKQQLSAGYVKLLTDAVSSGLIIMV